MDIIKCISDLYGFRCLDIMEAGAFAMDMYGTIVYILWE